MKKAGGITRPDFKSYYQPIVIKTARYWHDHGTELSPVVNSHMYGQLTKDKEYNGERILYLINGVHRPEQSLAY